MVIAEIPNMLAIKVRALFSMILKIRSTTASTNTRMKTGIIFLYLLLISSSGTPDFPVRNVDLSMV